MRSTTPDVHRPSPSGRLPATGRPSPDPGDPCSSRRVVAESARIIRRLQQLQARPWWRVSERELDELDARLDVLRALTADPRRA